MPKLGAKADDRPYNTRCRKCGCIVVKAVSRFGFDGKPSQHCYQCPNPYHNCTTAEREGCEPARVYGETVVHAIWDGLTSVDEHDGKPEDCDHPLCLERTTHKALNGERHPGLYLECTRPECEPPFSPGGLPGVPPREDAGGPWADWPPQDPGPWVGPLAGDEDE
jgi:hypothetical protein